MSRKMLIVVAVLALLPLAAQAQFGPSPATTTPEVTDLKPCMIVGDSAMAPAAFVGGMSGLQNSPTVTLDGVDMALIGAGAKAGGGRATISKQGGEKILELSMAGQRHQFVVLSPGNFWLHPEVRDLIPVHRRQPVPRWPHVDTNLPSNPPYGVNWKRPYLDWKPDESWLAMMLAPPAVEEPEIVQPEPAAASAEPEGVAAAPSAPAAPPGGMFEDAPPGDMMGGAPPQ